VPQLRERVIRHRPSRRAGSSRPRRTQTPTSSRRPSHDGPAPPRARAADLPYSLPAYANRPGYAIGNPRTTRPWRDQDLRAARQVRRLLALFPEGLQLPVATPTRPAEGHCGCSAGARASGSMLLQAGDRAGRRGPPEDSPSPAQAIGPSTGRAGGCLPPTMRAGQTAHLATRCLGKTRLGLIARSATRCPVGSGRAARAWSSAGSFLGSACRRRLSELPARAFANRNPPHPETPTRGHPGRPRQGDQGPTPPHGGTGLARRRGGERRSAAIGDAAHDVRSCPGASNVPKPSIR